MNRRDLQLITISAFAALLVVILSLWTYCKWFALGNNVTVENVPTACNIAVISIKGDILTYDPLPGEYNNVTVSPDQVLTLLREAKANEHIKGIILTIDSPGGSLSGAETIMNAVKREDLPVAALIGSTGESAAYLAASGADTIIASNYAQIGSIGVTRSYVQNVMKNNKEGVEYISLSSGRFKDMGDPNKELTEAERVIIKRDLAIYSAKFIEQVAENRSLPIEKVRALADGSAMAASLALNNRLIDALGDIETARVWFSEQLGVSQDEVVFCE